MNNLLMNHLLMSHLLMSHLLMSFLLTTPCNQNCPYSPAKSLFAR